MDDSFPQDYCLTCQGSGVVDGMKHVKLDMPAGTVHSTSIAFFQFVSFSKHVHMLISLDCLDFEVTVCNCPIS
jgi:hypothetical protein